MTATCNSGSCHDRSTAARSAQLWFLQPAGMVRVWLLVVTALGLTAQHGWGQSAGVPIAEPTVRAALRPAVDKAVELQKAGKLAGGKAVREWLAKPTGESLTLPAASPYRLSSRSLSQRARDAHIRIGWLTFQGKGQQGRLETTGGYALTADGAVATCYHCLTPPRGQKDAWLVAVMPSGDVRPVTAVIAAHRQVDAAVVRVPGHDFVALPLNAEVMIGDQVGCFSDPFDVYGYYSTGIVNRFHWLRAKRGTPGTLDELQFLRMNVSTDWAPGSSGAAVLDTAGNVVGHVAVIRPLTLDDVPPVTKPDARPLLTNAAEGDGGNADTRSVEAGPSAAIKTESGTPASDNPPAEGAAPKAPVLTEEDRASTPKKKRRGEAPGNEPPFGPTGEPIEIIESIPGPTAIVLHEAVPAKAILAILKYTLAPASAVRPEAAMNRSPLLAVGAENPAARTPAAPIVVAQAAPPQADKPANAGPASEKVPADKVEADETPKRPAIPSFTPPPDSAVTIGSPAPALSVGEWIQGEPVKAFSSEHAYIVEFWASWCGPCKATVPHVNALHKKFGPQGLIVIGQDVWERAEGDALTEAIDGFRKEMGDEMTYRLALDDKSEIQRGAMATHWMQAAGRNGIPCAFVVDKHQKVAWIGHPSQLTEEIVTAVLGDTWDLAAAKKTYDEDRIAEAAQRAFAGALMAAIRGKDWERADVLLKAMETHLPERSQSRLVTYRIDILAGREQFGDALALVDKLASDPKTAASAIGACSSLMRNAKLSSGDLATIERSLRQAREKLEPGNRVFATVTLANVIAKRGDVPAGRKMIEELLADPANKRLQRALESVLKEMDPPKADDASEKGDQPEKADKPAAAPKE